MLENLRAGDEAVLGDVADQDHRHAAFFGEAQQRGGHLLDLAHGTGGRFDGVGVHRLHGVHDHQVGHHLTCLLDHGVDQRLAEDGTIAIVAAQALGTHAHLFGTLLTGDVKRTQVLAAQRNLQAEGGLSDARLSADEHQ